MAVPGWFGPVGGALTEAANGYVQALVDVPDERLKRRANELKIEALEGTVESDRREAAAGGKPLETSWGLYTIDPVTQRYTLELPRPEQQRKPFAKEIELETMLNWSTSDDPYKAEIAKSYLEKQQGARPSGRHPQPPGRRPGDTPPAPAGLLAAAGRRGQTPQQRHGVDLSAESRASQWRARQPPAGPAVGTERHHGAA